jgi:2-(3-amino-3-carboxypropyl)histidine synthase
MSSPTPELAPAGELSFLDPPSPPIPSAPPIAVLPRFDAELFEAVRRGGHTRVALQVPAGLVRNAHDLAETLRRETGIPVVTTLRPCFGACDFPSLSETPDCDALVVLGHSPIPNVPRSRPMYFVEMRYAPADPGPLAEIIVAAGLPRRLGLVASVQHLDLVGPLTASLRARAIELRTGTGDHRLAYAAQALGCNYTSARSIQEAVDAYLFLGTGAFHPIGLAFATELPVWSLDPLQRTLTPPIDRGVLIRKRQLIVASAREARSFGILVSTFAGQNRSAMAATLAERARRHGRSATILFSDRIDPRDLEGRDLEAYVNTACPRIALDDAGLYPRPMLTPPEFLMALGELPLEPYRFDTYH